MLPNKNYNAEIEISFENIKKKNRPDIATNQITHTQDTKTMKPWIKKYSQYKELRG